MQNICLLLGLVSVLPHSVSKKKGYHCHLQIRQPSFSTKILATVIVILFCIYMPSVFNITCRYGFIFQRVTYRTYQTNILYKFLVDLRFRKCSLDSLLLEEGWIEQSKL